MNERAQGSEAVQALGLDALLAQVEALHSKGSDAANASPRTDPVRLHYIEAMARRLQAASPAVQAVLQVKLAEALRALSDGEVIDAGAAARPQPRKPRSNGPAEPVAPGAPVSRLGQLNHHLQAASASANPGGSNTVPLGVTPTRPTDLKSAVRFRETWARISAETEVDRAAHRAPENAGPLNAHNLVLRTLGHLRELSPDYLRRFMNHAESLMWLDHAVGQLKQPASQAKSAKPGKSKK